MGYGYNPIVGENWRYNPDCPDCIYLKTVSEL